jgi:hypothetical protein
MRRNPHHFGFIALLTVTALFTKADILGAEEGAALLDCRHGVSPSIEAIHELRRYEGRITALDSHWRICIIGGRIDLSRSLWCTSCATIMKLAETRLPDLDSYLTCLDIHFQLNPIVRSWIDKPLIMRDHDSHDIGIIDFQFFQDLPVEETLYTQKKDMMFVPVNCPADQFRSVVVDGAEYLGITNGLLRMKIKGFDGNNGGTVHLVVTLRGTEDEVLRYSIPYHPSH